MKRPRRILSQQEQDRANAQIYLDSMSKLRALPPRKAVPSLGIRWLCARHGYDDIMEALRGPHAGNIPEAVLYEIRFCVSWLSDKLVRMPPNLEALPSVWDDVKALHVGSYDPEVMDRIVKMLARMKKRAEVLDATSKTVN